MIRSSNEILTSLVETDRRLRQTPEEATKEKDDIGKEIGTLIREFRTSLGLRPTAFANKLQVSVQSVHRWERGLPPRTAQIEEFGRLLDASPADSAEAAPDEHLSPNVQARYSGYRELQDILQAERDSKQVFLLKTRAPFFSGGWRAVARQSMIDLLEDKYHQRRELAKKKKPPQNELPFFYFFVPAEPEDGTNQAFLSVARFLTDLKADKYDRIRNMVVAYKLDDNELSKMGIGQSHVSWIVTNYDDAARQSRKREIDYFLEVPTAVYRDKARQELVEHLTDSVWIEYPQPYVRELRESWDETLREIQHNKAKKIDVNTLKEWAMPYKGTTPIMK